MKVFRSERGYLEYLLLLAVILMGAFMVLSHVLDKREAKARVSVPEETVVKPLENIKKFPDELPRKGSVALTNPPSMGEVANLFNPVSLEDVFAGDRPQDQPNRVAGAISNLVTPGTDGRTHAVNAYLLHFAPFETKYYWEPMKIVSEKLKYALDSRTFGDFYREVWQTSKQSYRRMRGDCEDHAILLADWLIESGFDARVVLGTAGGQGHAWVVLFDKNQTYLLEATNKSFSTHIPLTRLFPQYNPEYMFNQDTAWANAGTTRTTDYLGEHWKTVWTFEAKTT